MKRANPKLPAFAGAILTADWHLRDTVPVCRVDDFWEAQWRKVDFITELQRRYKCPVLHAGDLFHHWKASPFLLTTAMVHLPSNFHTVLGNHDLPNHRVELMHRSGVQTLHAGGGLTILHGTHAKQVPTKEDGFDLCGHRVLVWHQGVWKGDKAPWPGCPEPTAKQVLKDYPGFDLIVTGDFHTPCIERLGDRLLVNPGSLMRQTADQIDFKPRVYLWSATTQGQEATPVYLPIDPAAVSREHLDVAKERDKRIEAFVKRLDVEWSTELSFEANLNKYLKAKGIIDARTKALIQQAVE